MTAEERQRFWRLDSALNALKLVVYSHLARSIAEVQRSLRELQTEEAMQRESWGTDVAKAVRYARLALADAEHMKNPPWEQIERVAEALDSFELGVEFSGLNARLWDFSRS